MIKKLKAESQESKFKNQKSKTKNCHSESALANEESQSQYFRLFNRTKGIRFINLLLLFIAINFLYGVSLQSDDDIYDRINRNLDMFGKTYRELSLNYVDELNIDRLMQAGLEGMTGILDPYTTFYNEENKQELEMITSGKYGGIGIVTELKDSVIVISEIMSGYEAEKKGLKEGDIILELDGKNVTGMKLEKFRQLVRGEPGTSFVMKVERNKEVLSVTLIRQEIILQNITYSGFIGNESDGIGYMKLERFTMSAENEFTENLKRLKSKTNLNGLIIDLRGNGGGLLESAIAILNKFTEKNNLLLITKGRNNQNEEKYFSKGETLIPKSVPLAVLVDKSTASASEILAGAVQDLDRGVIIGSMSFGKGLVQQIKDVSFGAKLKLTTKRYYTPSGRWIQKKNYFKENKSGVFTNSNMYEVNEFRTTNGRSVNAYGGITPDVFVEMDSLSEIGRSLYTKDIYYKFANLWLENNPGVTLFTFTEDVFKHFKTYLSETNFSYKTEAERKLDELKAIGYKKGYDETFYSLIAKLEQGIISGKFTELDNAKKEIKTALENEINKRLISQSDRIKLSLENDKCVKAAASLFGNIAEYNIILNIK